MSPEDVHIRVLRLGHAIQAGFRVGILGLRACPSILPNTWTHTHTPKVGQVRHAFSTSGFLSALTLL